MTYGGTMKPDFWRCSECTIAFDENPITIHSSRIATVCPGTLTPMYSRERLIKELEERIHFTAQKYIMWNGQVDEYGKIRIEEVESLKASLTAGEDKE